MKAEFIKNPDAEFVKRLKRRIRDNGGHCPCRPEKTPDTKCPCREFRETGECICGLYITLPDGLSLNREGGAHV